MNRIKLALGLLGLVLLLGAPAWTADTDFQFVTPGTAFPLSSSGATGATGYEWGKQPSAGAWATWDGATTSATDTLASKASARYRIRGFLTTPTWVCDATGCTETGTRQVFGEWSDASNWIIAVTTPACGKAETPAKQ